MGIARNKIIRPEVTPFYHCFSRCVRQAFLCGYDKKLGTDFSYRKKWIEERLDFLLEIFNIEMCTYAIMSNHYHLILRIKPVNEIETDPVQILNRWKKLYKLPNNVGTALENPSLGCNKIIIERAAAFFNKRLSDISWFMKAFNEYIARRANNEDLCSGRFWEGRFKSQALLTQKAILKCMEYVDLNPVRARISTGLEDLWNTGIKKRINRSACPINFVPFASSSNIDINLGISLKDYLRKLEHVIVGLNDEFSLREKIDKCVESKVHRMTSIFSHAMGDFASLKRWANLLNQKHVKGQSLANKLFA